MNIYKKIYYSVGAKMDAWSEFYAFKSLGIHLLIRP